jgi:hypothetical protein
VNEIGIKKELVVVPHDAGAIEFTQDLNDRLWSWSQGRDIAETDDLIRTSSPDFGKHGPQCHFIRVDVRNQSNSHHRPTSKEKSVRIHIWSVP